ncbi:acidic endochitinase SP2-like [Contarinia nasturtii]|uniref:acidic endochitinase SP2-like n=1 Tax=Contarinia nasturtii TaxID=265458 RepID=UPI0012D3C946|nr:acidic endochitinase SP2-like [Contarinia nasturtii]
MQIIKLIFVVASIVLLAITGGGAVDFTVEQVNEAMSKHGYTPNWDYLNAVVPKVNGAFQDPNEAAEFIAQCGHESGGYQYIEEIQCSQQNSCEGMYGTGAEGKNYHGRGFIQLSWPDNYRAASQALGRGDDFYYYPEIVAQDPNVGADVSIWYWQTRVANYPGVKEKHFGATTRAINSPVECTGNNVEQSRNRWDLYQIVCDTLGVNDRSDESGCYN